ncbi:CHCH domain-containing protein, partial [Cephalotus follicularis]
LEKRNGCHIAFQTLTFFVIRFNSLCLLVQCKHKSLGREPISCSISGVGFYLLKNPGEMALKAATAPYPRAARISDSPCYPQYAASLKCLEEFHSDKSKCQEYFDVYKECKKKRGKLDWNATEVDPSFLESLRTILLVSPRNSDDC